MNLSVRRCLFVLVPLLFAAGVSAQQEPVASQPAHQISLDVVVAPKSGPPVSGLQQQDFTVLDNKAPQTIASFQAVDGRTAPIEVILLIDTVNTAYQNVMYERNEIGKFLRAEGGHLAHPTTIALLTDTDTTILKDFSSDGIALSTALDQTSIGQRDLRRSAGFYGATERFQISLQGLQRLLMQEGPKPGRKIILWVSPGWPMLSGPEVDLSPKDQQQIFDDIVAISNNLRHAHVTLYSIDPLGTADIGTRTFYWQGFVKGVSKPREAQLGNLALEVIATQSGGLALNSSNDVAGELQKCVADLGTYYEISLNPPTGEKPSVYHHLEIKVDKPGLIARTRQGYYSQP
jgi:VWFA-related protein